MIKRAICVALGDVYNAAVNGHDRLRFALGNLEKVVKKLNEAGWKVEPPLKEENASKANVLKMIEEVMAVSGEDDWILFYFVGHGAKYRLRLGIGEQSDSYDEYFVTYDSEWSVNRTALIESYLADNIYTSYVNSFLENKPNRHFISILDCCYAGGMFDNYEPAFKNHTFIAASTEPTKAYFDKDTSFFFKALDKCWGECVSFHEIEQKLPLYMDQLRPGNAIINKPVIKIGTNFSNLYFK